MNDLVTNGVMGSVVVVVVALAVYLIATKKLPWNISNPIPDDWKKGKRLFVVVVVVLLLTVIWLSPSWQAPRPTKVWEFFKDYWLWVILILTGLYLWFDNTKGDWAKAAKGLVITLAVAMAGALIVHAIWGDKKPGSQHASPRAEVPLASSPQSEWGKWVIPPGGKSEVNTSPPGMHLVAAGSNFRLHAVYPDGHECSFGQTCPNASEIKNYATNEADETNTVRFAFAPN